MTTTKGRAQARARDRAHRAAKPQVDNHQPSPPVEFEEADRAEIVAARAALSRIDEQTTGHLDRWLEVSRHLRRSIEYADRLTNSQRNDRFRELRRAWLEAAGFLKHPVLKDKGNRSRVLRFTADDNEAGLRAFWDTLDLHAQMKLRGPLQIWNRFLAYQQAVAGIADARADMKVWWDGLEKMDRCWLIMPDVEEPDDEGEDHDDDDAEVDDEAGPTTEEIAATPFDEAVKRNPVELSRKYQEHAREKENRQEGRRRAAETRRRNQQARQQQQTGRTGAGESAEDEDETESESEESSTGTTEEAAAKAEPQHHRADPAHADVDAAKRRERIKRLVKVITDAIWECRTDLTLADVREALREVTAQVDGDDWRGQFENEPEPEPTIH